MLAKVKKSGWTVMDKRCLMVSVEKFVTAEFPSTGV